MSKNKTRLVWIGLGFTVILALVTVILLWEDRSETVVQARVSGSAAMPVAGFERAKPGRVFQFPRDHGPHPEFQTEWWYYTGNLQTVEGRRFGYQLTFFRRGLIPANRMPQRPSSWGTSQVYLAHFTLTDVAGNSFFFKERISRGAAGLAGATGEPAYSVWLEDWSVIQISTDRYQLTARDGDVSISLELIDEKGPVLQGLSGYSQKGPDPGNASYYISKTRLRSSGMIQIGEQTYSVNGLSWMDHEFSTSALAPDQIGWDWFSLQMDDRSELMVYVIRDQNGQPDPYSQGSLVMPDGSIIALNSDEYKIDIIKYWRSPGSGAEYPAAWVITVPSRDIQLRVTPLISNQELSVSFTYWEGAVDVSGEVNGKTITGNGYVEMTGYAHSMQGEF